MGVPGSSPSCSASTEAPAGVPGERSQRWPKDLDPCHPQERPGCSSQLQTSAPNALCNWEVSQRVEDLSVCCSHTYTHTHVTLFHILIHVKGETDRQGGIFHPLLCSPIITPAWSGSGRTQNPGIPSWSPTQVLGPLVLGPFPVAFAGTVAGTWKGSQ